VRGELGVLACLVAVNDRRLTIMPCEIVGTSLQKSRWDIAARAKLASA
jgi:hypothetical protein